MVTTLELSWTAGFLEGEGIFWFGKEKASEITLAATQVQKEPLERLMKYFGGAYYYWTPNKERQKGWSPTWRWHINGFAAASVMMTLYVLMSPRRQEQIAAAITHWKSAKPHRRPKNSPYCLSGHLLSEIGVTSQGECMACRRASKNAAYKRRKQREAA